MKPKVPRLPRIPKIPKINLPLSISLTPLTERGVEYVSIDNSLAQTIAAAIHYPEKSSDGLAILCPGYLDTKDYPHFVALAESLAKEGYTAVRFDPTGTWESEGDITRYTNTQYLKDIASIIEAMMKEKNYKYILLCGHSRGGQISLLYAARDKRVSAVVAIMPSAEGSMTKERRAEWQRKGTSISFRDIPGEEGKREFRVPYSHVEDRDKHKVTQEVKKVHVPVVFLAGELDAVVPPAEVESIFAAANEPKKYILLKGIGHDYRKNPLEIQKVNEEILKTLLPE